MNYIHKNSDSKIKKASSSSKPSNSMNKDGRSSSAMAMQGENIDM
jgi:hypothetical protein